MLPLENMYNTETQLITEKINNFETPNHRDESNLLSRYLHSVYYMYILVYTYTMHILSAYILYAYF